MDDFLKSVRSYLYERSASPLAGAFFFAWLILNYRIFFILFSGEPYSDSFAAIDAMVSIDWIDRHFLFLSETRLELLAGRLINWILLPGLLAASYIFLYPKLAAPVYKYALERRQELRDIKQKAEQARLLTVEESQKVFREIRDLRNRHDEEMERLRQENRSLQSELEEARKRPSAGGGLALNQGDIAVKGDSDPLLPPEKSDVSRPESNDEQSPEMFDWSSKGEFGGFDLMLDEARRLLKSDGKEETKELLGDLKDAMTLMKALHPFDATPLEPIELNYVHSMLRSAASSGDNQTLYLVSRSMAHEWHKRFISSDKSGDERELYMTLCLLMYFRARLLPPGKYAPFVLFPMEGDDGISLSILNSLSRVAEQVVKNTPLDQITWQDGADAPIVVAKAKNLDKD